MSVLVLFDTDNLSPNENFHDWTARHRCLVGCGMVFVSLNAVHEVIKLFRMLYASSSSSSPPRMGKRDKIVAGIDSNLVEGVTTF